MKPLVETVGQKPLNPKPQPLLSVFLTAGVARTSPESALFVAPSMTVYGLRFRASQDLAIPLLFTLSRVLVIAPLLFALYFLPPHIPLVIKVVLLNCGQHDRNEYNQHWLFLLVNICSYHHYQHKYYYYCFTHVSIILTMTCLVSLNPKPLNPKP